MKVYTQAGMYLRSHPLALPTEEKKVIKPNAIYLPKVLGSDKQNASSLRQLLAELQSLVTFSYNITVKIFCAELMGCILGSTTGRKRWGCVSDLGLRVRPGVAQHPTCWGHKERTRPQKTGLYERFQPICKRK